MIMSANIWVLIFIPIGHFCFYCRPLGICLNFLDTNALESKSKTPLVGQDLSLKDEAKSLSMKSSETITHLYVEV